jgi:hypothetical protein
MNGFLLQGLLLSSLIPLSGLSVPAAAAKEEEIVYYDMTSLFERDLNDPALRRRFWDETHLVVSLQGLVNRTTPSLFIRYVREPDDFWWEEMRREGGWLAGRKVAQIRDLKELLRRFAAYYQGAVFWDERVPATSNLASTIAGVENLLCLRYDTAENSLYQELTRAGKGLPVRQRLMKRDGSPLFTGTGMISGTRLPSTGSAKCDAYLWLIERYVKTGKANPLWMGYYLDGFWLSCWSAGAPENHTLTNQDFVIARRGVLFDLNVWDDEATVDDPQQPPGTDARTLKALLRAAYDRFKGDGIIQIAGFVPWAYKYTNYRTGPWSAGGKHEPVPTEWRYAEILSCYNAVMDADALGLSAMANASFYQHYPLAKRYPQNPKPTRESLTARGILDAQGKIVPRRYVSHYVGDYDAAAWLYRMLPSMWRDPARGTTPLSWAFNPNLCERFPLGMAWARERRTPNDWFVAGDSGAGYLNPGNLTPPRAHSGLPSGMAAWERHNRKYFELWDLSLTGFIIDGYAPGLSPEGLDAYSRFSPDGIIAQKIPLQGVHKGMPYLRMRADLPHDPLQAARVMRSLAGGSMPRFVVCRSILKYPSWYAQVEQELKRIAGEEMMVVDLYTLLWLVREYETQRASRPASRFADAAEILAVPDREEGLSAIMLDDGPFEVIQREGVKLWRIPIHQPPYYLYFDADDGFYRPGDGALEVEIEYLDDGQGRIELQYDSTDSTAPMQGAYKGHPKTLTRTGSGQWRRATFRLEDPRFVGSQNGGADLRIFNAGEPLLVRFVRIRKVAGGSS